MNILVLNAGSSSLKFSVLEAGSERILAEGLADWSRAPGQLRIHGADSADRVETLGSADHQGAFQHVIAVLAGGGSAALRGQESIAAVGHRVVHGGAVYTASVLITPEVIRAIAGLGELAPLHTPANLEGIEAARAALPSVPQVAVFDTAFHATIPEEARVYPVPYDWYRDWGLRRFGFHGLSHAYCTERAAQLLRQPTADIDLINCHLGNGCSLAAVCGGRSVDTTMGFTPLEGLMMGTRSGSVDPGLLLYVLRHRGVDRERLDDVLNNESGLQGISGLSRDMRELLSAAQAGNPRATLALRMFVHSVRRGIGAMAAALPRLDALIFTAGVGENAASIRADVCAGLGTLGVELDQQANAACVPDALISSPRSKVKVLVIHTREDVTILREVAALLKR